MTRTIDIGYRDTPGAACTGIDIPNPYYLFGVQDLSKEFWSLPVLQELGITTLSQLGRIDPVIFADWEMLDVLAHEIRLFHDFIRMIGFHPEVQARWLGNLTYCHALLVATAPVESIPELWIG